MHDSSEAVFAAGCFWGVEKLFKDLKGVVKTEVGYTGGQTLNPTYEEVKTGTTGHAEAISICFDPAQCSYANLLNYFFRLHDPTTRNRQGNDIGTQYRSAIFYGDDNQKKEAEAYISQLEKEGVFPQPIVTEVRPLTTFFSAESYHQDYLEKNPQGYMCHILRPETR